MNNRGFTLLELMVVVGIIAIIASLAYPSYQEYIGTTYQTQAVSDMKRCALELERQYSNNFTYSGGQCTPLWSPTGEDQSHRVEPPWCLPGRDDAPHRRAAAARGA